MSTSLATIQNPAGLIQHQPQAETSSTALAAREKASVEARFVVAYRNPRDIDVFRLRMLGAARRPVFAAVARFSKPVGGKAIEGPSIRFAEEVARNYGNLDIQTPVVFDDEERRTIRVTVTDLESNLSYSSDVHVTKTVERKKPKAGDDIIRTRTNSYGEQVSIIRADDDALLIKGAALVSKSLRTLLLRIAPSDIVEEAMDVVIETLASTDAKDPTAARKKLVDAFYAQGVEPAGLVEWLGHGLESVTPGELDALRKVFTCLKDGESTWGEIIEAARPGRAGATAKSGTQSLKESLKVETGGATT